MLRPEIQDLIDLYIQESRNEGIPPSEVNQSSWITAQLALERFEDGLSFGRDDTVLIQDWELFKEALS